MSTDPTTDPRVIACRLLLLELVPDELAARVLQEDLRGMGPDAGAKVVDYVVGLATGFMVGSLGHESAVEIVRAQLAEYVTADGQGAAS